MELTIKHSILLLFESGPGNHGVNANLYNKQQFITGPYINT